MLETFLILSMGVMIYFALVAGTVALVLWIFSK